MSRLALFLLVSHLACNAAFAQLFEAHYLFRGGYPIAQTAWSNRVEGVAHDDNYWYFTTSRLPATVSFYAVWKVPVGVDLQTVTVNTPGVSTMLINNVHPLSEYPQFGDGDVYRFNDIDYLVVPLSRNGGCITQSASVAFIRCDTLALVGVAPLTGLPCDASWVAINDAGELFTSRDQIADAVPSERGLFVYKVDWAALNNSNPVTVTFNRVVPMFDENNQPLVPFHMQGGEFSFGSQLLYISTGYFQDDNARADAEGIHVLETNTFRRVRHSTRGVSGQPFDFFYSPGGSSQEQPQGLTLWDLDDGRAPGIVGQLHVLVAENFFETVDFKHYTRTLNVDPTWTGCHTGTPICPFQSLTAGLNAAWDGCELRMRGGLYLNTGVISQRMRLNAQNGVARIGG
ncbi:MAG: hypothetical protein U0640_02435 [Phycisphaerales bacterium]